MSIDHSAPLDIDCSAKPYLADELTYPPPPLPLLPTELTRRLALLVPLITGPELVVLDRFVPLLVFTLPPSELAGSPWPSRLELSTGLPLEK